MLCASKAFQCTDRLLIYNECMKMCLHCRIITNFVYNSMVVRCTLKYMCMGWQKVTGTSIFNFNSFKPKFYATAAVWQALRTCWRIKNQIKFTLSCIWIQFVCRKSHTHFRWKKPMSLQNEDVVSLCIWNAQQCLCWQHVSCCTLEQTRDDVSLQIYYFVVTGLP